MLEFYLSICSFISFKPGIDDAISSFKGQKIELLPQA